MTKLLIEGRKIKKIVAMMLISALWVLTLNGCSTFEGFGNDMRAAGKFISQEANRGRKG